jgi:hypothetical protein
MAARAGEEGAASGEDRPKNALYEQARRIVAAAVEAVPEVLQGLGGVFADFYARDGDNVENHEILAALVQVGVPSTAYPALERVILARAAAADEESGASKSGTPSKKGATSAKKGAAPAKGAAAAAHAASGDAAAEAAVVFSRRQMEELVVLAVSGALEALKSAAMLEARPATIITELQVAQLRAMESSWDVVEALAGMLGQTDHRADLRSGITVDFFAHHLLRCFEEQVDDLRTAIFLTVMREVLDAAQQSGFPSAQETFEEFKRCFVRFCDHGAGGEYEPFTVEHARVLTTHVSETFFRFYSSFRLAFTCGRDGDDVSDAVFVEEPLAPPPLREGTLA